MKTLLQTLVLATALGAGLAHADVVLVGNPAIGGTLTADQASDLYLGKGNKLPNGSNAAVFELENGNALRVAFHAKVTGKSEAQLQSYWSRLMFTGKGSPPTQLANTGLMKSTIASTPNAVGYIDESEVDASVIVLLKP